MASLEIDYPPDFSVRYGYGKEFNKAIQARLDDCYDRSLGIIEDAGKLKSRLAEIRLNAEPGSFAPFWTNGWFPPLDGLFLYYFIATRKPKRYVEIGSGNSTKFARRAVQDFGLETTIISIDPVPRAEIDSISDVVIRQSLEAADLSVFADIEDSDVVFLDGSHRCLQNSDVTIFFLEVLPALPPETCVGVHDIFWPRDYPPAWKERYYSEQYILGAYLLGKERTRRPVLAPLHYLTIREQERLGALFPENVTKHFMDDKGYIGGSSFWFES